MKTLKLTLAALAAGSLLTGTPALADDEYEIEFETTIVKDRDEVPLDPSKAYILMQSPAAVPATFFKVPTDAERETVSMARAVALTKAQEKWVRKQRGWEQRRDRAKNRRERFTEERPIEPTEENFNWPPAEQEMMFSIGSLNRFDKGKGLSLYLQEVPPGEYVYYGTINLGLGACACMGTVKFDADAGTITALRYDGVWLGEKGEPIGRGKMPEGVDTVDAMVRVAMIIEPVDEAAYDPRLPQDWIRDAELTPVSFVPNWFGAEVNRLAPIPGVLAYNRDEVIDVQAQLALEEAEKERAAAEAEAEALRVASEVASDGEDAVAMDVAEPGAGEDSGQD